MKLYELTYLISPQVSEEELRAIQEKITSHISKEGGILNEVNLPVRKRLAYEIKGGREAFFATFNFHFLPEKLEDFEKELKAEKRILRYLIFSKKPEKMARVAAPPRQPKPQKVELKEIERKLKEILGE